jgi:hypothetical protein
MPDGEGVADPRIFDEALLTGDRLHHDVWPKPPGFEAALRIELTEPVERGRRQQMDGGTVEKRPLWEGEIGNGVSVVEALDTPEPTLPRGMEYMNKRSTALEPVKTYARLLPSRHRSRRCRIAPALFEPDRH